MVEAQVRALAEQVVEGTYDQNTVQIVDPQQEDNHILYPWLSACSNQHGGGILILGISSERKICGIEREEQIIESIRQQCTQMEPEIDPLISHTMIESKRVVTIEIQECDYSQKPCYYRGTGRLRGSYLWVDQKAEAMTPFEIYLIDAYTQGLSDELQIVQRSGIESFSGQELSQYLRRIRRNKPQMVTLDDQQILELQGITQQSKPTICGLMTFGIYPQAYFPSLYVITRAYSTNDSSQNCIESKRIEGTIVQMLCDTLAWIKGMIRHYGEGQESKGSYPQVAVRELVLNALVHRDYSKYSRNKPVEITLYPDHMIIESPGTVYGGLETHQLSTASYEVRNPHMFSALELILDQEAGLSGLPVAEFACKQASLPLPVLQQERESFKAILYAQRSQEGSLQLTDTEVLILRFCHRPRSRKEIAEHFGYTQAYAASEYIGPLVKTGLLQMTMPEVPKSKHQKYVRT